MTWNRNNMTNRLSRGTPRLLVVAPTLVGLFLIGCGDDATATPVTPTPEAGPDVVIPVPPDGGGDAKPDVAPMEQVGVPTFSVPGGTYSATQTVTISSATSGATIWFTRDGNTPVAGGSEKYSTAITVDKSTQLKAIAVKDGMRDSLVNSVSYTISVPSKDKCAPPSFTPAGGTFTSVQSVSLASATSGATIYYTVDGSTPTAGSQKYSGALTVGATQTIKAFSAHSTCNDSDVSTAIYTINIPIPQTATPTITPAGGNFTSAQTVTITAEAGAQILYTTDGTFPSFAAGVGKVYSAPFSISATATVVAVAKAAGKSESQTASQTYNISTSGGNVAPATITPQSQTANAPIAVTLDSATPNATLCYTLDGTTPTCSNKTGECTNSTLTYNRQTFTLDGNQTGGTSIKVRALACAPNAEPAATATEQSYTFQVGATSYTPTGGEKNPGQSVVLQNITPNSVIHYTTDGTDPTCLTGTLINPQATGQVPYGSAITSLSASTTVKAIGCRTNYNQSEVGTNAYTVKVPAPTLDTFTVGNQTTQGNIDRTGKNFRLLSNITSSLNGSAWACYRSDGTAPACGATANTCATGAAPFDAYDTAANGVNNASTNDIPIPSPTNASTTVHALQVVSCKVGWTQSDPATFTWTHTYATPTITSNNGAALPTSINQPTTVYATVPHDAQAPNRIRYSVTAGTTVSCSGTLPANVFEVTGAPVGWDFANQQVNGVFYDGWKVPLDVAPGGTVQVVFCPSSPVASPWFNASGVASATIAGAGQAVAPTANPVGGTFNNDLSGSSAIVLTSSDVTYDSSGATTNNGVICYTLDNSDPTCTNTTATTPVCGNAGAGSMSTYHPVNTKPVITSNNTPLKAIACVKNKTASGMTTQTYNLKVATPTVGMPSGVAQAGPAIAPGSSINLATATTGAVMYYSYSLVSSQEPTAASCSSLPVNTLAGTDGPGAHLQGQAFPRVFTIPAGLTYLKVRVWGCKNGTNYAISDEQVLGAYTSFTGIAAPVFSLAAGTFTDVQSNISVNQGALNGGSICVTSDGVDPVCDTTNNSCLTIGTGSNPNQWTTVHGGTFNVARTTTLKARACANNTSSTVTSVLYTINLPTTSYRTGTNLAEPFTAATGSEQCNTNDGTGCNPQRFLRIETGSDTGPVAALAAGSICWTTDGSAPSADGTCVGTNATTCTPYSQLMNAIDPTHQITGGSIAGNVNNGAQGVTLAGLHKTQQFRSVMCKSVGNTVLPTGTNLGASSGLSTAATDRTVTFTGYARSPLWDGSNSFDQQPQEQFDMFTAASQTLVGNRTFHVTWDATYLYLGAKHINGTDLRVPNRYFHAYLGLSGLSGTHTTDTVGTDTQGGATALSAFSTSLNATGGARYHVIWNSTTKAVTINIWNGQAWVSSSATGAQALDGNSNNSGDYVLVRVPWSLIESPTQFVVAAGLSNGTTTDYVFPRNTTDNVPFSRTAVISAMFDRGTIMPPAGPRAGGFRYAGQHANNVAGGVLANQTWRNVNWGKTQWDPIFGRFSGNLASVCSTSQTEVLQTLQVGANTTYIVLPGSEYGWAIDAIAANFTTPFTWSSQVTGGAGANPCNGGVAGPTFYLTNQADDPTVTSQACTGTEDQTTFFPGVHTFQNLGGETLPNGVTLTAGNNNANTFCTTP